MATKAAELMAAIIDRIEDPSLSAGRPAPTIKVVETLRFVVRAGVQCTSSDAGAVRPAVSRRYFRLESLARLTDNAPHQLPAMAA
jgi:hypothetical protein